MSTAPVPNAQGKERLTTHFLNSTLVVDGRRVLAKNWLMASATGLKWYIQFFFYNLGHVMIGAVHMTQL